MTSMIKISRWNGPAIVQIRERRRVAFATNEEILNMIYWVASACYNMATYELAKPSALST
jgi:hypothetical protein